MMRASPPLVISPRSAGPSADFSFTGETAAGYAIEPIESIPKND
jgi:hypothetical protein